MMDQPVTAALRALREEAKVGVREMARRLGMSSPSSYSHYEDPKRFKDKYLPMEWAIRFADALAANGMDRSRVLALAGSEEIMDIAKLDTRFRKLSRKRQRVLLSILSDLEAAEEVDRGSEEPNDAEHSPKP